MLAHVGTTVTPQNYGDDKRCNATGADRERGRLAVRQYRLALLDIVARHKHRPTAGVLIEVELVLFSGDFEAWVKAVAAGNWGSGPVHRAQVHRDCGR